MVFRGTTPTVYIHANVDISEWDIEMTIANGNEVKVVKGGDDISVRTEEDGSCYIWATLSQEETLNWRSGTEISVQLRAIKDGTAIASTIGSAEVNKILRNGTIGD